jgi:glycosyltransferase involved in cell wall biosynthesis
MTTVIEGYVAAWDHDRYALEQIGTYIDNAGPLHKAAVFLVAYARLWLALLARRPAIVHLHASQRGSTFRKGLCALTASAFGCAVVWHQHGSEFEPYYRSLGRAGRGLVRRALNAADLILVLSPQWRERFEALALRAPVAVLPNAVEPPAPSDLPPFRDRRPAALTLGRLGQRKGTYDILLAAPAIVAHCPAAQFWLGGDGELERVRTAAQAAGLETHVHLLGWVAGQDKTERLLAARLFLLPSYHEGAPVAIIEAMAHGLPVISTPVGGIAEQVEDGVTGFLVQPGDTAMIAERVRLLLDDVSLAERMGARGRERVLRHFTIGPVLDDLYRHYDSLLAH